MKLIKWIMPLFLTAFLISCSEEEGKTYTVIDSPYVVSKMSIITEANSPVVSKEEYINCHIKIESENSGWNSVADGRIRGRGNSTWLWYPKKPYRIKLDQAQEILGLKAEKDWILLANYRDPTHMMNTFVFLLGEKLGLPYTNYSRYVEVTLNNVYIGLYQLTEQVEQGSERVAIDKNEGFLISLNADDGPELNPTGLDNFWSTVYKMPVCVKSPDVEAEPGKLQSAKNEFTKLEQAVKSGNYSEISKLLNISSLIDYLIIQELVYNVEVAAPRSIYMFKDKTGLWNMGPLWDFDAGFDFDWGTMYIGHNFFNNYKELVLGTDPANHKGGYIVPSFFTDLFKNKQFVSEYKNRWNETNGEIMTDSWLKTTHYVDSCRPAMKRNSDRWPIDKEYDIEIRRMENWLRNRINYLNTVINNYPAGYL